MNRHVTPKRTIALLFVVSVVFVYVSLEQHYKTRSTDIAYTAVSSANEMIRVNNFIGFAETIKHVMYSNKFVKSVHLFDGHYRKLLGFGDEMRLAEDFFKFDQKESQVIKTGFFKYVVRYELGNNRDFVLLVSFYEDNSLPVFAVIIVSLIVFFLVIYVACGRLDIDRFHEVASNFAVHLMRLGFHEMKQLVSLFNIFEAQLREARIVIHDKEFERVFLNDLHRQMTSINSMMSILKLAGKKKCREDEGSDPIDLSAVADECLRTFNVDRVTVDAKYEHSSFLRFPVDAIYAIIGNLIKNAYAYSDGLIWVRTEEKVGHVIFRIANTGKVIPKDVRKVVMKPGVSLNSQSGLGLHICDMWCRQIGARILLESTSAATEFTVIFPLKRKSQVQVSGRKKTEVRQVGHAKIKVHEATGKTIAVIEDIETFRRIICQQIMSAGFKVVDYESVDSFLKAEKSGLGDLCGIVIDRHGYNGFDAVVERFPETCRSLGFKGSVVLYSNDTSELDPDGFAGRGFDYVVPKSHSVSWNSYFKAAVVGDGPTSLGFATDLPS